MADRAADVSEALHELEGEFGLRLTVPDQVSIARRVGAIPAGSLTSADVGSAFRTHGLTAPPKRYADALVARVERMAPRPNLLDVLVAYRSFAIRELSGQFGGATIGREEELRNNLLTFLPERGYTEARTGRGRTDILLPAPTRIIEVKVWDALLTYEDGLVELGRYINTERAEAAYMVVFGDRVPLPPIVASHDQAIAEHRALEGITVPVVAVVFDVDQPSKAAKNERRRARARG